MTTKSEQRTHLNRDRVNALFGFIIRELLPPFLPRTT
jgi:hypothetical protein